jgi:hypothetical protein
MQLSERSVCMHVLYAPSVCMICLYVCVHVCMHAYMYLLYNMNDGYDLHVCGYVCMYAHTYVHMLDPMSHMRQSAICICIYECIHVHMYILMISESHSRRSVLAIKSCTRGKK